jgi:hypothetical protein
MTPQQRLSMLSRGRQKLRAMKKTAARSTTSPAGKKTLAEAIVMQVALNSSLQRSLLLDDELYSGRQH